MGEVLPGRVVTSSPVFKLAVRLPPPGARLDWPQTGEPHAVGNEAQIEDALGKKCNLDFHDEPLVEAIKSLAAQGSVAVWFDQRALTDAGVGTDTPVTRSLHDVSLRTALKLLLGELDLTYVIHNEVLMITSQTEAETMLVTKVYPVFDLVSNQSDDGPRRTAMWFRPVEGSTFGISSPSGFGFQSLIHDIVAHVAPNAWDEIGGPGAIQEFVNSGALVISQTTEIHEEIAAYLRALREVAVAQR